jgi:hypothetical protein
MSINNYSNSSTPFPVRVKISQQVFHVNGSFHLDQFQDVQQPNQDDNPSNESFNEPTEGTILMDNVEDDNPYLFNCNDYSLQCLNQDSDEFTNDDQSLDKIPQAQNLGKNWQPQEPVKNIQIHIPKAHTQGKNSTYEVPLR